MKIGIVGGGPGGLAFAVFIKALRPGWTVRVWERRWPPPSGFGLVLPTRAVTELTRRDERVGLAVARESVSWSAIDIYHRGYVVRSDGHHFCGMGRTELLTVLRDRCQELDVVISDQEAPADLHQRSDEDLLVVADGMNSTMRSAHADELGVQVSDGACLYVWLSTSSRLDAFAFHILSGPYGVVQLHSYPFGRDATAIVAEMRDEVWQRFRASPAPAHDQGMPRELGLLIERTAGRLTLDGDRPKWRRFTTVTARRWSTGRLVLLGDAAHACHFSIGSGTALAIDDGWTLAQCVAAAGPTGVIRYEELRRPAVAATCAAAAASQRWFENIAAEVAAPPAEFARQLLMRSGRVPAERLRLGTPEPMGTGPVYRAEHRMRG